MKNNLIILLDAQGNLITEPIGQLRANAEFNADITVIAPFDLTTVVSATFTKDNRVEQDITQYLVPNGTITGKDRLGKDHPEYQRVYNYNVFEGSMNDLALAYVAKFRAGLLFMSIGFGDIVQPPLATNYKGKFGQGVYLPEQAENGDFYICDEYNFHDKDFTFTLDDYVYFYNNKWHKSNYRSLGGTDTFEVSVSPNLKSNVEVTIDQDLGLLLAGRVAVLERAVSDLEGNYIDLEARVGINEIDITNIKDKNIDQDNRLDTVERDIEEVLQEAKDFTYDRDTIDNKDANTLQEAKDYTYSQVEIDNKDTAIMNKANNLENANMLKDVVYNNVNGVLTFTKYDDTTKEIDLPLELIVTSGYYDEVANELVLVLANSSEIRIPVDNLLTDLDAHNIRFNGSGTNYLVNKNDVESAVKELDTRVKTNADNVALKVSTSDIVNNLTSTDTNKPLSANQGRILQNTTAKLVSSNVFTQPQQVPNATLPQHTTNLSQVETMFEMFKQQLRGYNLARPDLTGKEYLGEGVYRLSNLNGITVDYNIYNGEYELNGTTISGGWISNNLFNPTLLSGELTAKMIYISGSKSIIDSSLTIQLQANPAISTSFFFILDAITNTYENQNRAMLYTGTNGTFTNYKFKLQLEKGTETTPYTVPGRIPQYATQEQENWIIPTLLNGWTGDLKYYKDAMGRVWFRGVISGGTSPLVCNLPAGYRLTATQRFPVLVNSNSAVSVAVVYSSTIENYNSPITDINFNGMSYRAEA